MDKERIEKEMHELEEKIEYHFKDISWLAKAMGPIKIEVEGQGKNGYEYENEGLATVGDAVLKLVIADNLYRENMKTKGEITVTKSALENNSVMHKMMFDEGLIAYAYNGSHFYRDSNIPKHKQVRCSKKHTPYVEAIVAAVYYDSNFDTARNWICDWLLPLLKKYQ